MSDLNCFILSYNKFILINTDYLYIIITRSRNHAGKASTRKGFEVEEDVKESRLGSTTVLGSGVFLIDSISTIEI